MCCIKLFGKKKGGFDDVFCLDVGPLFQSQAKLSQNWSSVSFILADLSILKTHVNRSY